MSNSPPRSWILIFIAVFLTLIILSCRDSEVAETPALIRSGVPAESPPVADPLSEDPVHFDAIGYLTRTVSMTDAAGNSAVLPLHIWYPTSAEPVGYEYDIIGEDLRLQSIEAMLALEAPVDREQGPYPLLLFFHGGFTCGTQSLFLTEYLAHQGFIVAAPDFPDEPRMCGEWDELDPRWKVLGGLRDIRQAGKEEQLAILEDNFRVPGASAVLDELLAWNADRGFILYHMMDESRIGVVGHSLGGETILGLIGPHPVSDYEDKRIRAAVVLSGAVFPFQGRLGEIEIPVMVMQGDEGDSEDLHQVPRRIVYDDSKGPGYFLMIEDAVHGSFGNGVCPGDLSPMTCASTDSMAKLITSYSADFFTAYLTEDEQALERIQGSSPGLAVFNFRED